jgi:hypothetical protein
VKKTALEKLEALRGGGAGAGEDFVFLSII